MKDYLKLIKSIELNKFNCDFVDIRIEDKSFSTISIENHKIINCIEEPNIGVFIRVFNKGKWYYNAFNIISIELIRKEIQLLIDLSSNNKNIKTSMFDNIKDFDKKIFLYENNNTNTIPLNNKRDLILGYDAIMKNYENIKISRSYYIDKYSKIYYGNSKNVFTSYDFVGFEIRLMYVFVENGIQFMSNYGKYSDIFEELKNLNDLIIEEINETKLFINAPVVNQGNMTVVLSPSAAGVFAHESFGHKSEADFMIGDEKMKKEWKIGKKVGSDILSIIDNGNIKGVSGYVPFDDEGNIAEETYLIKKGVLSGRLHSINTAYELKEHTTGNGRAINTEFEPIVRMTTTYIDKGDMDFDTLIKDIEYGVFIKTIKHGSGLSTFTIAPLKSYIIKNGKITDPVRINVITGTVFETLNLIDGLSDKIEIKSSLIGGCGKMEQYPLRVSAGGPYVRVKKMNIS